MDKSPGLYYVCSSALRRNGCHQHQSLRYEAIENAVLTYCRGLNPADILPGREEAESRIQLLRGQLAAITGKLENLNEQEVNLTDAMAEASTKEVRKLIDTKLRAALDEKKALEKQHEALDREFEIAFRADQDAQEHLESLTKLMNVMKTLTGQELTDLKARLREEIRNLITRIDIIPYPEMLSLKVSFSAGGKEQYIGLTSGNVIRFLEKEFDPLDMPF